ncbi:hypothetical protein SFRURICE_014058 [Spodoptera frugiperda]|nr:hypothetical protein SFRURICE_014058 [Spodoptera frugiperda]
MARNVTVQCTPTFHHLCYKSHVTKDWYDLNKFRVPRWSNGRKCDCRARDLRFDFRVKHSIIGLTLAFRKFLSDSTEPGNVPNVWSRRHDYVNLYVCKRTHDTGINTSVNKKISNSCWSSSRKRYCQARGVGLDFWIGHNITGSFSVFQKFISSSTDSDIVPRFSPVSWVRLQTYNISHAHDIDLKQQFVDYTKGCSMRESNTHIVSAWQE